MGTGSYFHSWSAAPVTLTNKLTVKLPVVLIHAFCDVPELTGTLKLAERSLRDMGVEYFSTAIPIHRTGGTIATRTRELVSQIQEKYHNRQIHLFGHSMGGLNARDIAARSSEENGFTVVTVTTFGTPHRGVKALGTTSMLNRISTATAFMTLKTIIPGIQDLTCDSMSIFNQRVLDNPTVRYFSWAGYTDLPTLWTATSAYGDTDSLVNVDSAEWGTHLGTIQGLDHHAIINKRTVTATLPHLAAAEGGQLATVQLVENNLLSAVANVTEGVANNLLAPTRALMAKFKHI
ncbi:Alpha/Beta hydrolase protein [Mycena pura]|uniref:Alpha/Beta hydrolase protein n=1 Tax=Mycena pura TaxID=153505 RepID=A0AAD6Y300_9AGAR|nr:Alpha/Beta hydrolase protein [Mycena pura]